MIPRQNLKGGTIMERKIFKKLIAIVAVTLFISVVLAVSSQGQIQAKAPVQKTELDQHFQNAHESFLKKDFRDAASEIRKAEAFFKQKVTQAKGEEKQVLIDFVQRLDKLADQVEKGAVPSVQELDHAFAQAYYALANYYWLKASDAWAKRETSQMGRDLQAAVLHLERSLTWTGHRIKDESAVALQEVRRLGERMEKRAELTASEVNKGIDTIGKEIEKAGKEMGSPGSSKISSIQISEKSVGSVNLGTAIMKVAEQILPAVVYIEVTESQEVENPFWNFRNDPFFRRFFGIPKMPRKFKQEMKGLGSGMIIDTEGHILTNYHVAGGATKIEVTLADGSQYPAKLVGGDSKTDLAVIQISAPKPLPHVIFEDSDKVEVGEWVVAIGAPRALEKTVTQGIISAKHRTGITDPNSYQDFLQTDAPINPGNSGGPLLNLYGNVVGVNAAIATESGGFEGIGFTIPSNMAVYVANALIAHGKVERGWLGVTIQNLTPELAKSLHLESVRGVLVVDVVKGGPAEQAGMRKNDVVVTYRGREIPDSATLRNAVAETPVGQEVKLVILRNEKKEDLTIKIESQETATKILTALVKERLGVEVRLPTPQEVEKYGLTPNQGVVTTWLDPKGPLKAAGFEVGDMILAINSQPVEGMESFVTLVSALPPHQKISILALDHRSGNTGTVWVVEE
jgi:serine protease Do